MSDTNITEGPEANQFTVATPYGNVLATFLFNDYDRDPRRHVDEVSIDFRADDRLLLVNGIAHRGQMSLQQFTIENDAGEKEIAWRSTGGVYNQRADGKEVTDNARRKLYDMAYEVAARAAKEHPCAIAAGRLASLRRNRDNAERDANDFAAKADAALARVAELERNIATASAELATC